MENEKSKIQQKRVGFIWNMLSSVMTAASSVILLMIVKRSVGVELSANYSVAVAVANVLINIGHLNGFGYQISDVTEKFSFQTYLFLRKITISVMLLVSVAYVLIQDYDAIKSLIIFLYCAYRAVYAYADVFQGRYQQKGRVDLAAKLQFYKVLIPDFLLAIMVMVFQNVCVAISSAMCAELIYLLIYNRKYQFLLQGTEKVKAQYCCQLLLQCMPLFFSAFITTYILNSSKYAIDKLLESQAQVYYSILLLPATTVHMIASFVYRPLLTEYAEDWKKREIKKLRNRIGKVMLIIIGGITFVEVVAIPMILPVLEWLYAAPELESYAIPFLIMLLAGGLNAIITFLTFVITIMRQQGSMFWIYVVTFTVALILPEFLVQKYNFIGAAISFLVLATIQLLLLFIVCLTVMYKESKISENMGNDI